MKTKSIESRTASALEFLRSIVARPRLEAQQVSMLLTLQDLPSEGVTMQALGKACNASQSFISRNCQAFGAKSLGKRLVGLRIADDDPRYRTVFLTEEGRASMQLFVGIIEGTSEVPRGTRHAVDRRTK
jgi:hypothetical protein